MTIDLQLAAESFLLAIEANGPDLNDDIVQVMEQIARRLFDAGIDVPKEHVHLSIERLFGSTWGSSKEDIAQVCVMVLEAGDDREFTEQETASIVDWMASRMSDTLAQTWANSRQETENDRLANEISEDEMYDRFAEADIALLDAMGLDGNPGYVLPEDE